jgi:acetylornithine deacetylase
VSAKHYLPVEMIEALVAFDTTSRESNLELIRFVEDYLKSHGVESALVFNDEKSKANLVATIGPATTRGGVVLSGHSDVVPVDGQEWSSDPFRVVARDGRLYGRGTCDMKGSRRGPSSSANRRKCASPTRTRANARSRR